MATHSVHRYFYYLGFIHAPWVFLNSPSKNGGPCYLHGDTVTDFVCLLLFGTACMTPQVKAGVAELWQRLDHDPNDWHVQSGQSRLHRSVHVPKVKIVVVQQVPYNIDGLLMNDGIASSKKELMIWILHWYKIAHNDNDKQPSQCRVNECMINIKMFRTLSRIAIHIHPLCKTWIKNIVNWQKPCSGSLQCMADLSM